MIDYILVLVSWSIIGFIVLLFMGEGDKIGSCDGLEFLRINWIYSQYSVNWLGALVLFILFNSLCPIGTICYWLYKICTIGRRSGKEG